MLKIDPRFVDGISECSTPADVYPFLQSAIELEHSTIPPYLTAYYSLKPGLNDEVAALLRSVVVEEMLHMTIAGNILISIGGSPAINSPGFVPDYPGPLPMGIGGGDFRVHIAPFSMSVVKDTFMVIEEPENPVRVQSVSGGRPAYRTIGEFYEALQKKLGELSDADFGHADRQVLSLFSPDVMFPITDAGRAAKAIDIIIRQGEGTSTNPFESPGDPAHYYRFAEIYRGSRLIEKNGGFAYGGSPIPFVTDGVFPMKRDPAEEQFAEGTYGRRLSDNFIDGYSALLNALHGAFNGAPDGIGAAMGLMYQLRLLAHRLMSTPLHEGRVETAGPVFKYRKA